MLITVDFGRLPAWPSGPGSSAEQAPRAGFIDVLRSSAFRKLHRQTSRRMAVGVDSKWNVSALTPKSLTWDRPAFAKASARHPRRRFENEAVAWQLASQRGGWAAFRSYVDQSGDRQARRWRGRRSPAG